ncbi:MAG TPA: bifunctional hydroxymethylpyrimidine kinase/phosphomethylpyrimidine kinase [Caulobacteraceae bacterium]|nr:bifunctional hydroxymethylpyrimidine kinase/phosphomethylpyrimidine kinase [Caulobacteraceae bacterium]
MRAARGRVLIIAGSDPSGGAGVQGDIRTVTALAGYASAAITALTVQNSLGVTAVRPVAPALVADQVRAVLDDIGADAVKIGMLCDAGIVRAVTEALASFGGPVVIDPVLVSTSGAVLLDEAGVEILRAGLLPRAALLTPNALEAERLTGLAVRTTDDLRRAGASLLSLGAAAVLMKGGHVEGETVCDVLMTKERERVFESPRVASRHTHGTGCALASAAACGLAQGLALEAAVARAHAYVAEAIRSAPGFGAGAGPIGLGIADQDGLRHAPVDRGRLR